MFLKQIIAIMIGGAIGSASRFWIAHQCNRLWGNRFPYGILLVNVVGCVLIGFLGTLMIERYNVSPIWRAMVLTGFLGGLTTFSAFSFDTFHLFNQGNMMAAILNVLFSLILCLLGTGLGVFLGRLE